MTSSNTIILPPLLFVFFGFRPRPPVVRRLPSSLSFGPLHKYVVMATMSLREHLLLVIASERGGNTNYQLLQTYKWDSDRRTSSLQVWLGGENGWQGRYRRPGMYRRCFSGDDAVPREAQGLLRLGTEKRRNMSKYRKC